MSDEKVDNGDTSSPPSPEYQAILDDLKAYDNPEVFHDETLPQIYKFRIVSTLLPDKPTIITVEIDGSVLPSALVEAMFSLMSRGENAEELYRQHGDKDFAEFRANLEADKDFDEVAYSSWLFFVRHLPTLLLGAYDIAALSSFTAAMLSKWREEPDDKLGEVEAQARSTLEAMIASLEKHIKRIVGTRSTGRPPKAKGERFPEIVRRVLMVARGMMGDARGKDAVPGLKGIAFNLDTNEQALGKQLVRAGHPWSTIRTYLENLPPDQT